MHSPPEPQELEVSVFGPGRGECIVVHLGFNTWIVVDSCINRESGNPVALDYLSKLRVDVASCVRLIVASHWHDDHIKGIGKVIAAAESATFVDSAAYPLSLLSRMISLGVSAGERATAVNEYSSIFETLGARRKAGQKKTSVGPERALQNTTLLALKNDDINVEVTALSPSSGTFNRTEAELAEILAGMERRKQPKCPEGANKQSVVLSISVGSVNVLLGADLEADKDQSEGWQAIINSAGRTNGKAHIFKVPHHGSTNAYSEDCWRELLMHDPVAIVTPYSQSGLPSSEDIERLCAHTKQVYLTSDFRRYKGTRYDRAVERTLKERGKKLRPMEGNMGHVRARVDIRNPGVQLKVDLFNGAERKCV